MRGWAWVLLAVAASCGTGSRAPASSSAAAAPASTPTAGSNTPENVGAPMVLATRAGTAIAVNGQDVFYVTTDQPGLPVSTAIVYTIRAAPKAGSAARVVSTSPDYVVSLAATDQWVVWTTVDGGPTSGVHRAPAAGGAAQTVFSGIEFSEVAVDDEAAYFAHFPRQGAGSGAVYAAPHVAGRVIQLAAGVTLWGWRSGLAVDATHVYFVDDPPPANRDGTIDSAYVRRVPRHGGKVETVVTCTDQSACGWFALRVDNRFLYDRDRLGGVHARPKDGGAATTLVASGSGSELDVNGGLVCWNDDWSNPRYDPDPQPPPGIRCGGPDGASIRELETAVAVGWGGPRLDANGIAYVRGGSAALVRRSRFDLAGGGQFAPP